MIKCLALFPTALAKVWYTCPWKSSINYMVSSPRSESEAMLNPNLKYQRSLLLLLRLTGHFTLWRVDGIDFAPFLVSRKRDV